MSLNGLRICTACDRNWLLGCWWMERCGCLKYRYGSRMLWRYVVSRITWPISNHNKSMTNEQMHDVFCGNGKSTPLKRWLLLTCVCCAYVLETLKMAATSDIWSRITTKIFITKRASTRTMHLVKMEKGHLRNDGYFWHVCVAPMFWRH